MCSIVPLSTTPPRPVLQHHLKLELDPPLPDPYANPVMWVKADIVLTVAFHRLRLLHGRRADGKRFYDVRVLEPNVLADIKACVRAGLGL
jgi:uncharacterized protein YifN (PemK superfamily)